MNKLFIAFFIFQIITTIVFIYILKDENRQIKLWEAQVKVDKKFNDFIDYQKGFNKKVDDLVIVNLQ